MRKLYQQVSDRLGVCGVRFGREPKQRFFRGRGPIIRQDHKQTAHLPVLARREDAHSLMQGFGIVVRGCREIVEISRLRISCLA